MKEKIQIAAQIECQSVKNFLGLNYDFETYFKNKARELCSWATKIQMWSPFVKSTES